MRFNTFSWYQCLNHIVFLNVFIPKLYEPELQCILYYVIVSKRYPNLRSVIFEILERYFQLIENDFKLIFHNLGTTLLRRFGSSTELSALRQILRDNSHQKSYQLRPQVSILPIHRQRSGGKSGTSQNKTWRRCKQTQYLVWYYVIEGWIFPKILHNCIYKM